MKRGINKNDLFPLCHYSLYGKPGFMLSRKKERKLRMVMSKIGVRPLWFVGHKKLMSLIGIHPDLSTKMVGVSG